MTKFKKIVISFLVIVIIVAAIAGFVTYKILFTPNTVVTTETEYLYIPTGSNFESVIDSLTINGILKNERTFVWTSKIKKYDILVKSGKYKITNGESNWQLINKLRSGNQEPVKVIVPSTRTIDKLCEATAKYFEFSEVELSTAIHDTELQNKYGVNDYNVGCLFIPNTYEFYWNTTPEQFIEKMVQEYNNFWTENRKEKAKQIGLSPIEVSVLASIVQSEQMKHNDEKPIIAGLYLNRLKKRMMLESDPTLIFALGDFSVTRVYDYHKKIQSPYNTYLNLGLPPGPILIPDISSIDAVLNPKEHNYIFMCAKDDLSGYHYFSTNYSQHLIYAKMYHNALNKLNIK